MLSPLEAADITFSPHAWGWTEGEFETVETDIVFPTRVGVDRAMYEKQHIAVAFSPHAWGWTVLICYCRVANVVFPTRVGVDRNVSVCINSIWSFPHTRGGGPGTNRKGEKLS